MCGIGGPLSLARSPDVSPPDRPGSPGHDRAHGRLRRREHDLRTRFWRLTGVRSDVEDNPVTTLPNSFVFTEPRGAALFAYDNVPGGNELSSAEEESSGRIRVELSGCEPGDTVRLTFDEVELGSELHDLPSLSFDGEVVAVVSDE